MAACVERQVCARRNRTFCGRHGPEFFVSPMLDSSLFVFKFAARTGVKNSPAQIRTGVKGSKGPYAWPLHSAENWIFSSTGLPGVTSPIICVFIILRRLWRLSSCLWGLPWLPLFYRPFSSGPSGTGRQRSFSWPPRQAFWAQWLLSQGRS